MNSMRIQFGWTALIVAMVTTLSCQSGSGTNTGQATSARLPREESKTADEFASAAVRDVVVMPVDLNALGSDESASGIAFASDEMRLLMRRHLIEKKHYAVPKSLWVDQTLTTNRPLETDARLVVAIDQWDASALAKRGVIYASAKFELRGERQGDLLWSYRCEDLQLTVEAPHGGRSGTANSRAAARRLAETALSRMPRKR